MLRRDLVGQNRARPARVHVAAPDAVEVEGGAVVLHLEHRVRIVGDEPAHPEVLGGDLQVDAAGPPPQVGRLELLQRLHAFEEPVDLRRVPVVRDQ